MTDYRDNFTRGQDESRDDPAQRWRRNEDRYRREAGGQNENRFDEDRYEANRRNRDFGYGRAYRDDDYGGRGSFGRASGDGDRANWREQRGYPLRDYYASRDYGTRDHDDDQPVRHWHERDRETRAGHPYAGTYGGTGDSRYFTGTQGSWAVAGSDTPRSYYGGGQRFGADYRPHGYDADDDGRRGFWDRASDEVASWFGDEEAARRREDDHRGHGPKGYVRSDERIREDANDRLTDDWRVDASNVTVTVKDGEITLDGTVANREGKRRAEDVVDGISGVKHVQNNLRVQQTGSGAAYTGNWATNTTSTAEGGTLSQSGTSADKQGSKI
jgi:osmotically-inducible protein OsmY